MREEKCQIHLRHLRSILSATFLLAVIAFCLHDYVANPQPDNQVLRYGYELDVTARYGGLTDILLNVRKYPLLYAVPIAVLRVPLSLITDLRPGEIYPFTEPSIFLGRIYAFLYAGATFIVFSKLAKRLFGTDDAMALLQTSLMFFLFSSAVRPHIPVTCWTLLALLYSLRLRESHRTSDGCMAFGSALVAFCTLQNGLLAFIFPIWAFNAGHLGIRRTLQTVGIVFVCLLLAVPLGYPFLLAPWFGHPGEFGFDLGHNAGSSLSFTHAFSLLGMMLGSDVFILLFAGIGLWRMWAGKDTYFPGCKVMLVYITVYLLLFSFQTVADARFMMPILPMLVLIGATAFARSPTWVQTVILSLFIIIFLKYSYLGFHNNTYQQTRDLLGSEVGTVGVIGGVPTYHYNFPISAMSEYTDDLRYVVSPALDMQGKEHMGWELCHRIVASSMSDNDMFLWTEVPYALWYVLESRSLGPNINVYCRESPAPHDLPGGMRARNDT